MPEETKAVEEKVETKAVESEPSKVELSSDEAIALLKSRDEAFQARLKAEKELEKFRREIAEKDAPKPEPSKPSEKDALVKSWEEKCAKLETEIKRRDKDVVRSRVDSLVSELSSKIDTEVPELFKPMIEKRVKGELTDDGKVRITCLDKNGEPSAMTPDELLKEVVDNKKYSRYLVANRSSGSESRTEESYMNKFQNMPAPTTEVDLSAMPAEQLAAHIHKLRRL